MGAQYRNSEQVNERQDKPRDGLSEAARTGASQHSQETPKERLARAQRQESGRPAMNENELSG